MQHRNLHFQLVHLFLSLQSQRYFSVAFYLFSSQSIAAPVTFYNNQNFCVACRITLSVFTLEPTHSSQSRTFNQNIIKSCFQHILAKAYFIRRNFSLLILINSNQRLFVLVFHYHSYFLFIMDTWLLRLSFSPTQISVDEFHKHMN